jgi:AcrR family transcriptional regulator
MDTQHSPTEVKRKAKSAKGEQARIKLKKAALTVLERVGYHKMRITDVTKEAGVAAGLFYHYFKDLKSLTLEVLTDYVAESQNREQIEKGISKGDWYERILAYNLLIVKSYDARPGLMRCLLQLADEEEEFSSLLRASFIEQLNWLVKLMPGLFPDAELNEHQALMVIYTLASSSEVVLRDYYINHDPSLNAEQLEVEDIAELLSVIFYRGLFLQNPPIEKLRYTKNLRNMSR